LRLRTCAIAIGLLSLPLNATAVETEPMPLEQRVEVTIAQDIRTKLPKEITVAAPYDSPWYVAKWVAGLYYTPDMTAREYHKLVDEVHGHLVEKFVAVDEDRVYSIGDTFPLWYPEGDMNPSMYFLYRMVESPRAKKKAEQGHLTMPYLSSVYGEKRRGRKHLALDLVGPDGSTFIWLFEDGKVTDKGGRSPRRLRILLLLAPW